MSNVQQESEHLLSKMRFFIRNKTKYDPSVAFKDAIIAVDVDHTLEIGKIKEVFLHPGMAG